MDVINENDSVIDRVSQKEIYEKLLPHRIVHILVFNAKDELLLQLRSKNKSFLPRHWVTSAGGHVQSEENYEEAALRELEEELGFKSEVKFYCKDRYEDPRGFFKMLSTFKVSNNGPFDFNIDEVESVKFFPIEKIKDMIKRGEKFHPELLFLLNKHIFT